MCHKVGLDGGGKARSSRQGGDEVTSAEPAETAELRALSEVGISVPALQDTVGGQTVFRGTTVVPRSFENTKTPPANDGLIVNWAAAATRVNFKINSKTSVRPSVRRPLLSVELNSFADNVTCRVNL